MSSQENKNVTSPNHESDIDDDDISIKTEDLSESDFLEDADDDIPLDEDDEENQDDIDMEEDGWDDAVWESSDTPTSKKAFKVLDVQELINNQQETVVHCSEVLGIPLGVSGAILRAYNWDKEKVFADFLESKEKVSKKANVNLDGYEILTGKAGVEVECPICFDDYDGKEMLALNCRHFACTSCWKGYLTNEIKYGPSCLMTKCPQPKCEVIVDEGMFQKVVDKSNYKTYGKFIARSFVDDNPRIRWCPAPNCGKAVYCPESTTDDVECECGMKFCFKCSRESHAPCNCNELTEWLKKEKDESETANWLTANTKLCPKCNSPIEKNGGCNHITCGKCKYEFCWICSEDWKLHSANTGGYYKCNRFKEGEKPKNDVESARAALEKYIHYYKRYAIHSQSQKFEKQLREKAEEKMKELQKINKYSSWVDVEYIQKAVEELIECRRSLKYTYVYAYYLTNGPEKDLFEYLQEDLEKETELLSGLLEGSVEKFDREKVISSSKSAEKRLKHLLEGCRQGLTSCN